MIIDGKKIAEKIKEQIKKDVAGLGVRPGIGIVLVGNDPASHIYVNLKCKVAAELGFSVEKICLPEDVSQVSVIVSIKKLNAKKSIHGIIVQIPLPKHIVLAEVAAVIDPKKDIDCFHPTNLAALFSGAPKIIPPTAEAVMVAISSVEKSITGKHVVIVGSGFFGRQAAAHCINNGATVTITNAKTKNLANITGQANILITAVGRPGCITADMVKEEAIIIDVGITKRGKRVFGDVAYDEVSKKVRAITPVPGGVGPLTVVLLMQNVLTAVK